MIKLIDIDDMERMAAQLLMLNTYHLCLRPGINIISKFGGLHNYIGWNGPIMTDSGGFQAFSLGMGSLLGRSKFKYSTTAQENSMSGFLKKYDCRRARIDDNGITFKSVYDGTVHRFTPESVLRMQEKMGADAVFVLDECTSPSAGYEYTKESMERTHRWARLSADARSNSSSMVFGIVQGGIFEDLRKESARYIASLDFDGIGIGGAFGKDEMYDVLDWVVPLLPRDRPRHLLGVGTVRDIFESVRRGIDLFDCVGPQRIGRAGYVLINKSSGGNVSNKFRYHITNSKFTTDDRPLDPYCSCPVCKRYSRSLVNHLFKVEPLSAMRLVSYHNLHFLMDLMRRIRKAIKEKHFDRMYREWIA